MARKLVKAINLLCFFIYNRIVSLFIKLQKNKFAFLSEANGSLDGNLKAVYDYLDEKQYKKKIHTKQGRGKISSLKETFSVWYDISTSKYIILDDFYGLTSAMKVRKNQEVIQLWHGAGAYKKFGYSRTDTNDKVKKIHRGYRKYTKVIVSSENVRSCYAEAFGIDKSKVYAKGVPRTDELLSCELKEKKRENFLKKNPSLRGKKIILFAPTYRGDKVEDANYDFNYADVDRLIEELGEEYAVITRWHPALKNNILMNKVKVSKCNKAYDFSTYEDINDLLIAAHTLITDYSSSIFDYFLLNKPIVLFTYDRDEYIKDRGLYFDFDKYVFGEVVSNREDLALAIKKETLCEEKRRLFNRNFTEECKGTSTEAVINMILER